MLLVARSISLFVVARIMQGIASSFVSVVGLALVVDTVEKEKMGQILGYVGLAINREIPFSHNTRSFLIQLPSDASCQSNGMLTFFLQLVLDLDQS